MAHSSWCQWPTTAVNFLLLLLKDASQLYFVALFDSDGNEQELWPFIDKQQRIWHMEASVFKEGQHYGYAAKGSLSRTAIGL